MLVADGLTSEQFTVLWRDAMASAPDVAERARLVLEFGRVSVREQDAIDPMMIAVTSRRDPPMVVVTLPEVPSIDHEAVREAAQERLAELAATEVYLLVLLAASATEGQTTRLLMSWGESLDGDEAVWMQPMRWVEGSREEAAVVRAPMAEHTELSRRARGLLVSSH